jgi:RHS repeat-associated protein
LGSVRQLIDATGKVAVQYDYDPYGNQTTVSGTAVSDIGYAGYFHHAASGLNFAVFRAYDSRNQRWLNRDPSGERGGTNNNLYGYAFENPVSTTDPYGLWAIYIGISGEAGRYGLGATGGTGFIFDGSGNYGTYGSVGGGIATPGASGGISVGFLGSVSNTPTTISDFGGPFLNASIGGGADGGYGAVDAFVDPQNPSNFGFGLTGGVGTPGFSAVLSASDTSISNRGNIFQDLQFLDNSIRKLYGCP